MNVSTNITVPVEEKGKMITTIRKLCNRDRIVRAKQSAGVYATAIGYYLTERMAVEQDRERQS